MPVAAFRSARASARRRAELEYDARIAARPSDHWSESAGFRDTSPHSVAVWLHDIGVRQPPGGLPEDGDWNSWWHESVGEFTPSEAIAVWDVIGGGNFYDTSEAERVGDGDGCYLVRGPLLWKEDLGSVSVHGKVPRGPDGEALCPIAQAFGSREDAETFVRANWDPAREGLNPFAPSAGLSALPRLSSLDGPRLHDWLLDCGFPTPPAEGVGFRTWYDWWAAAAVGRPLWQLARAWQAFDRVAVSEIVEVEWEG